MAPRCHYDPYFPTDTSFLLVLCTPELKLCSRYRAAAAKPITASLKIHSILIELSFTDGWTTDDLQYLWKTRDPVQIVPDLHLPRFTLEKYINAYCNIKTNTGKKILLR